MAVNDGIVSAIEIEPGKTEVYAQDVYSDNGLSGDMYALNNTGGVQKFMCYIAVYNSSGVLKYCDIISVELNSGDWLSVVPEISGYEYSEGDYLQIFVLEDGNLKPVDEAAAADIICE